MLGDGQDGAEVVGGMTQPSDRQVGVQQIGVTHQHRVEERGLVHRRPSAAHQCRGGRTAELGGVFANRRDELTAQGTDGAGDAVQHIAFHQRERTSGQVGPLRADDEAGQFVHNVVLCHAFSPSALLVFTEAQRRLAVQDRSLTSAR
jgi:hypothetical protein